ncbi:pyruvate kinase [bacterium]|nr:pyruvate kinase [bacterium]RQV95259.1 MAG: pyruvate kinase [bacterium]
MTKIVCTIGPSSGNSDILRQMGDAGMAVARLNFSHSTREEHARRIEMIRQLNEMDGYDIKILQDLEGYRIRLGNLPDHGMISISPGQKLILTPDPSHLGFQHDSVIPFDYRGDLTQIKKGFDIFIDDGNILLKTVESASDYVETEVVVSGTLKSRKGVNIPELHFGSDTITGKDKEDILFGREHGVDWIAQSFVRNREDVIHVKEVIARYGDACPIIAKIENREGIDNLESILQEADGIMIARGDMGVSIPLYEVPMMQKKIIRLCNQHGKMDITATQMLESMTENHRPTRAEVSDVANAVIDGSDYVMLSGETAVGKYPVQAVRMMKQIIDFTTQSMSK